MAALDRDYANGALHVGVGDAQDSFGSGDAVDREAAGNLVYGGLGASDVDMHFAAQKLIGGNPAQHYVRIGDGGAVAFAIAGRSRIGAGGLRPDAQQAAFVDARQGPAASAYRVDIEHGNANRK